MLSYRYCLVGGGMSGIGGLGLCVGLVGLWALLVGLPVRPRGGLAVTIRFGLGCVGGYLGLVLWGQGVLFESLQDANFCSPSLFGVRFGLCVYFYVFLWLFRTTVVRTSLGAGGSELVINLFILLLGWVGLSLTSSSVGLFIWLELVTLGGAYLLTGLAAYELGVGSTKPEAFWARESKSVGLGVLTSVVLFLWFSSLASLLLVGGCYLSLIAGGLWQLGGLGIGARQAGVSVGGATLGAVVLGLAFLFKLMLQPIHLALFSFYRQLSLGVLSFYLLLYYVGFLSLLGVRLLGFLAATYELQLVLGGVFIGGLGGLLGGGLGVRTDLRWVLALSTICNLTLLCCTLGLA